MNDDVAFGSRTHIDDPGEEQTILGGGESSVVGFDRESGGTRQWTLKGIPENAVDLSREAAKRSGMKLNSWVTAALQRAAESDPRQDEDATSSELAERMDIIERYLRFESERLHEQLRSIEVAQQSLEAAVKNVNTFLVKMYAQSS